MAAKRRIIQMAYEIDYQDYQRALQFDQRTSKMPALRTLTQLLIDQLDPKETDKVLDVGTGTGRLGTVLRDLVPKGAIIGIDSGYGMLRVAKDKILKSNMSNFHVVRGKAEVLPFPHQAFDSAYLMLSFHHFTEPELAVAEIYRTLRAKGYLVSVDPVLKEATDDEEKKLNLLIEEAFQIAHGPQFRFFTTSELRRLYEKGGFSIETCEAHQFTFQQSGIEGIPMGPHWLQAFELLLSNQEEDLANKFEQNYFTFRQKQGQWLVKGKMRWITIKAVKG
jgi:ubiquinone/menaquinone biosynthesis C-methylase UbiE